MDPDRAARETPFGGTIAHGFLTLCLASRFAYDCFPLMPGQVMGINYGMNKPAVSVPCPCGVETARALHAQGRDGAVGS